MATVDEMVSMIGSLLQWCIVLVGVFVNPLSKINFIIEHQSKKEEIDLMVKQSMQNKDYSDDIKLFEESVKQKKQFRANSGKIYFYQFVPSWAQKLFFSSDTLNLLANFCDEEKEIVGLSSLCEIHKHNLTTSHINSVIIQERPEDEDAKANLSSTTLNSSITGTDTTAATTHICISDMNKRIEQMELYIQLLEELEFSENDKCNKLIQFSLCSTQQQ